MPKSKVSLLTVLFATLPMLTACVPAVIVTGAAVGVMSAHDRRSSGVQADDEVAEWKGSNRLPAQFAATSHVNFIAYNRILLLSGETADDTARQAIGEMAKNIDGIRKVHNELLIAPVTSFSSRSNDGFISSKYKARLLDSNQVSANHIKPVTENATLFLMGIVNEREAKAAVAIARTTDGVRKVVNLLEIVTEAETRRMDNTTFSSAPPAAPAQVAPVEAR